MPPQLPEYQTTVSPPLPAVADSVEESPLQIVDGLACGLVGALGSAFTVTVTSAQLALTQLVVVFFARA